MRNIKVVPVSLTQMSGEYIMANNTKYLRDICCDRPRIPESHIIIIMCIMLLSSHLCLLFQLMVDNSVLHIINLQIPTGRSLPRVHNKMCKI